MQKLVCLSALTLLLAAPVLAQNERVTFHSEGGLQTFGAVRMELGGPDDMQVVKGNPLSADIVNTHVQHLADGNTITNEETSHFYRDADGRTRRENKLLVPGNSDANAPTMIMINDPVAHTHFVLNTNVKSADRLPDGPQGPGPGNAMYISKRIAENHVSGQAASSEQKEDLGTQTIDGFVAKGTRSSHVIPAGQIGNQKPIMVTTESWYSDDLGMTLLRVHNDPWTGEVTTKVTNVRRGEQDASLFTPPADYTIENGGANTRVIRLQTNGGQELPPPPPPQD